MRSLVGIAFLLAAVGCNQNPYLAPRQSFAWQRQLAQTQEMQRRASGLDVNNRDLHAQLAQSQQQVSILTDEVALLRKQLGEVAQQLATSRAGRQEADKRIAALETSTQRRGGATITANRSAQRSLPEIDIPGLVVRADGQTMRIELPSDKLFLRGTATLQQGALTLIDQVAATMARRYPREPIAVEGHTDSDSLGSGQWRDHHQLSIVQATAIFEQLTTRHRMSPSRLRVVGYGASRPIVSNGTPEGKARNRRVEIVVYPAASS